MSTVKITFPCDDITLEGIWEIPDRTGPFPAVVVCHPHPQFGGDMYNDVVYYICRELTQRSIAALRFNFRGVGESGGSYGGVAAAVTDLEAAIAYLFSHPDFDENKLGLAGYSFGAEVCTKYAHREKRLRALTLVSPVFGEPAWHDLAGFAGPKLIVAGEQDYYLDYDLFKKRKGMLPGPAECRLVAGTDHFWVGYETIMAELVGNFFRRIFG